MQLLRDLKILRSSLFHLSFPQSNEKEHCPAATHGRFPAGPGPGYQHGLRPNHERQYHGLNRRQHFRLDGLNQWQRFRFARHH